MAFVDTDTYVALRRNSGYDSYQNEPLLYPAHYYQSQMPLLKSLQSSSTSNGSSMSVFREILQSINPRNDDNERTSHEKSHTDKANHRGLSHFQNSRKYKTEMCRNFELKGFCQWGQNCCYAHGKAELRTKTSTNESYKTKICRNFFEQGYCSYGSRCQYFHFKDNEIYKELLDSLETKIIIKMREPTQVSMDAILQKVERRHSRLKVFGTIFKADEHESPVQPSFEQ